MQMNLIYNENCLKTMKRMPENFIDLTVTSPPYDNLRKGEYEGLSEKDWKQIIKGLYKITKEGGVVVWVVADAIVNNSETGTSFKQALYAMKIGFNLHDTMYYEKNSPAHPVPKTGNRYSQLIEYMFIWSKGLPKTANLICDRVNLYPKRFPNTPPKGPRFNIWKYTTSKVNPSKHPAVFPEELVQDHIRTWSIKGDLIYDPFMGGGTTARVAKVLGRNYIGSEISKKFYDKMVIDNF